MRWRPARIASLGALTAVGLSAAPAAGVELTSFTLTPRCLPPVGHAGATLRLRVGLSDPARLTIRLQRRLDSPARVQCPRGPRHRPFVPGRFGETQTFGRTLAAGVSVVRLPVVRRAEAGPALAAPLAPVHLDPGTYRLRLLARDENGTSQVLLRNFIVLRTRR
jgi:hypothetical protein